MQYRRPLIAATFALFACNSTKPPLAPDTLPLAPDGVSAVASDQSVTVRWNAAAGATGYVVYYNGDDQPVALASSQSAPTAATSLAISGLVNARKYRFAVQAGNGAGGSPLSVEATAVPGSLSVSLTAPAGQGRVALNTPVAVTFNKPASVASITVNTSSASSACSGSLQLSSDGFATCVTLATVPAASSGGTTFTVQPRNVLAASTTYAVRVTSAALDATSVPLASPFTSAPFTTNVAMTLSGSTPADGATSVPVNTALSISFVRPALPSTMTANISGTTCSGALQLSSDGFSSCLRMAATPVAGNGNQTYAFAPASLLLPSTTYQLRVASPAQDQDGVPLPPLAVSSFVTDAAISVTAILAAAALDGQTGVPLNTADLGVLFTKPAEPSSVTVNTADSRCSGSLQLSRGGDSFTTCVRMGGQPMAAAGNTRFLLTPAAALDGNTTYLLRVTTSVVDVNRVPMPATYTTPAGFVTDASLSISSLAPADGATTVALSTAVSVTFDKPAASITTNVDTQCSGSLQLSSDGFTSCVAMKNPAPATSNGGATFTAQPASSLQGGALYRLRITSAARDLAGVALAATFTSGGFLTDSMLAVVSTSPKNGDTGVTRGTSISVTFDKAADTATITSAIGASTACGTFQVSTDPAFGSCLAMQAQPAADAGSRIFTATPLATLPGSTAIYLRVTTGAHDQAGVALAANSAVATFTTDAPLLVAQVIPANHDAGIALNTTISVTFNKPAQLSVNSVDNSCATGSLQLSNDNFATCVQMAGPPVKSTDGKTFTARPAAILIELKDYAVRVTSDARDLNGFPTAGFTSRFTTDPALVVLSTVPADNDVGVQLNSTISVTFNKPANPASVTVNTDGSCSGSIQLSADDFAHCVRMASQPTPDLTNQLFTVTPLAPLAGLTLYQLRVTAPAVDAAGVALAVPSITSFTTEEALAVVATSPVDGAAGVSVSAPIVVTFNKEIELASLTFNTDTVCNRALQVSADNFGSCVPLKGPPANQGGNSWQLRPARPLPSSTTFRIRLTTDLTDLAQLPLAAQFTQATGFTTAPRIAVTSVLPADGATGVAVSSTIAVSFNKVPYGLTVNTTSDTGCDIETFNVSADNFTTCVQMTGLAFSADQLVWTATPAALATGAVYKVRVAQTVHDVFGVTLASTFQTPQGFATVPTPAMTVVSAPANGAAAVAASSKIVLSFSRAPSAATVTSGGCASSVTLSSGASCVALTGPVVSPDGKVFTYTPVSTLAYGQQYTVAVSTAVQDGQGAPLGQGFGASFTVAVPPADPVLASAAALQTVALSWPSPAGTYHHANVYSRASGSGSYALLASTAAGGTSFTAGSLLPFRAYDFKVTSLDAAGNESLGATALNVTTAFSGSSGDWLPGQATNGLGSGRFRFTWTDTDFVAAVSTQADAKLLSPSNPDALWIAFDTDPTGDATGEWSTPTAGANDVIWPFKANYVVELLLTGASTSAVNVRPAGGPFAAVATASFNGALDEIRIPRSAIGSPAGAVRFALIAVNKSNGHAYDLAPANPAATDVSGYHASLTAAFAPGAASWTPATTATSVASSPLSSAAALVTLSVNSVPGSPAGVKVHGTVAPFNDDTTLSSYALLDTGTHGDAVAGDGTHTGVFNLGASTQELFFQLDNNGTAEFRSNVDRIWTLSGGTEALPTLTWNTAYSKTNSFTLTFNVTQTAGTPAKVVGSVNELGNFSRTSTLAPLSPVGGGVYSTGPVSFGAYDFTISALQFKAYGNDYESGNNNTLDDDVINRHTLSWSFNSPLDF